jgi:hypothetical protein
VIGRRFALAASVVALASCSACAPRTPQVDRSPIVPVDAALVPATTTGPELTVDLDTTTEVRDAVKSVGPQVLVSDAQMWDIHHGQRLVGALEVATLKKRVDPRRQDDRDRIIGQILGSHTRQIQVDGLPVWTILDDGTARQVFVWFGARNFGVLQVKGEGINPGQIADVLIRQIASKPAWHPLAPQDYRRRTRR